MGDEGEIELDTRHWVSAATRVVVGDGSVENYVVQLCSIWEAARHGVFVFGKQHGWRQTAPDRERTMQCSLPEL